MQFEEGPCCGPGAPVRPREEVEAAMEMAAGGPNGWRVSSMVGGLATYQRVRQITKYIEDNRRQVFDTQRRNLHRQRERLELKVLRCWVGNKGIAMKSYFKKYIHK